MVNEIVNEIGLPELKPHVQELMNDLMCGMRDKMAACEKCSYWLHEVLRCSIKSCLFSVEKKKKPADCLGVYQSSGIAIFFVPELREI